MPKQPALPMVVCVAAYVGLTPRHRVVHVLEICFGIGLLIGKRSEAEPQSTVGSESEPRDTIKLGSQSSRGYREPQTGPGTAPQTGPGIAPRTGQGIEPQTGLGIEPQTRPGTDVRTGPGTQQPPQSHRQGQAQSLRQDQAWSQSHRKDQA